MIEEIIEAWKKEDLLKQSLRIISNMFDTTHLMFEAAKSELENSEKNLSKDYITQKDIEVNQMQIEVRRKVLEHLSFSPAQDITASLVFLYVVNDLERIGDYCKNMEDEALVHNKHASPKNKDYPERISKVAERVSKQFLKTKNAFLENDKIKANEIVNEYSEIKKSINEIITGLEKESRMSSGRAITHALYTRHIKRVAAHLKNIASSVVNPFDRVGYKPREESKTQ